MNCRYFSFIWIVLFLLVGCKQDDFKFDYSSSKTPSSVLTPGISQQSYTQSRQVQMQLSTSEPYEMTFFINKACIYKQAETWEAFSTDKTIELPNEDGVYEISVMFRNKDHFPSECQKLKVVLDRVGPIMSQVNLAQRMSALTGSPSFTFPVAKDWLSPIKKYQGRIVDNNNVEVLGWTDISPTPESLQSLTAGLSSGYAYFIELRAQDQADNVGAAVKSAVFYAGLEITLKYVNPMTGTLTTCVTSCIDIPTGIYKMSVSLNFPIGENIPVQFYTAENNGKEGLDYFKVNETKQLVAGTSSVSFLLNVRDSYKSGNRQFYVRYKTSLSETEEQRIVATPTVIDAEAVKATQPTLVDFKAGNFVSCSLDSDKNVYCHGGFTGTGIYRVLPAFQPTYSFRIAGLNDAVQLSAMDVGACALRQTGQIVCWDEYQFGSYVSGARRSSVVALSAFTNVSQFAVAPVYSANSTLCAVNLDGTIRCAGNNADYLLANGTNTASASANLINGFSVVGTDPVATKVVMGSNFACALTTTGAVYCWGNNVDGSLARNPATTTYLAAPGLVSGLTSVRDIYAGANHVCAVTVSDKLFCWGKNSSAQLGLPITQVYSYTPVELAGMTNIESLSLGGEANCALRNISGTRKPYCWGFANSGGMGQDYYRWILTPEEIPYGSGSVVGIEVSKTGEGVCFIKSDGMVYCRGGSFDSTFSWNSSPSLGQTGFRTTYWSPYRYQRLSNSNFPVETEDITAHGFTLCMWDKQKTARCHGVPAWVGAYGSKSGYYATHPMPFVNEPLESIAITAHASEFQCYVDKNKKVWCRGANSDGVLGDGTTTSRDTYTQVPGLANVKSVVSGRTHVCALTNQSEVYCWGTGSYGQLGVTLASPYRVTSPLLMTNLPGGAITKIVAGSNSNCILLESGKIYCWGVGNNGRLGNGTTTTSSTPVQISSSAIFKDVSIGHATVCAVSDFGALYCWGANSNGAVGDGTTVDKTVPVQIQTANNDLFTQVSTSFVGTCAVTTNGEVYCWGWQNATSQVGNGGTSMVMTPAKVRQIEGGAYKVVTLLYESAADGSNWASCALIKINGTAQDVKCWGHGNLINYGYPHSVDLNLRPMYVHVGSQ